MPIPAPPPPPGGGSMPNLVPTAHLSAKAKHLRGYAYPERYQMAVYNQALQFLDPTSRGQIMRLMAQRMPELYSGYATAATPPPPTGAAGRTYAQEMLSQGRLNAAVAALTPEGIFSALKGGREVPARKAALIQQHLGRQAGGDLSWLRDYLTTAQQAYGTGPNRMSRAERAYAQTRLGELGERAAQGPGAAYLDLAQALVSPVMAQAPASGGLGTGRALTRPGGELARGGIAKRNPALT